jgi:hypothetical protein
VVGEEGAKIIEKPTTQKRGVSAGGLALVSSEKRPTRKLTAGIERLLVDQNGWRVERSETLESVGLSGRFAGILPRED